MHTRPILVPDQNVSRNLKKHFVWFPDVHDPEVFNLVEEALQSILAKGFDDFILHTETFTYHCTQTELAAFGSNRPEHDDERQP